MVAQPCEKENCACPRPHVRMTSTKRQMLKATDAPTDLFAPTTELAELVCKGKLCVLRLRAPCLQRCDACCSLRASTGSSLVMVFC